MPHDKIIGNPVDEYSFNNGILVKSSDPTLIALIPNSSNNSRSETLDGEDKNIISS